MQEPSTARPSAHPDADQSADPRPPTSRQILRAELLSIGSELTVGDTRDTNSGELAKSLTAAGVTVTRMTALPDRLDVVVEALRDALARADLVVSTGGLGPTPDDLTREAIAAACGETPVVDREIETWLREMWARRGMPFPESNLKQAWRIPSAAALANPNGTAPGWFVTRPDGRVVVALPGPPREMRPMWHDHVMPRLVSLGLGADIASRTFRLTGIGESQVAEILGDEILRRANPEVATYARVEAVDVRVSAIGVDTSDGTHRPAAELVAAAADVVIERLGAYVWSTGETTWSEAIGARLGELGWRLGVVEIGTGGQVAALFGDTDWLVFDELLAADAPAATSSGSATGAADPLDDPGAPGDPEATDPATDPPSARTSLAAHAHRAMRLGGTDVGLAVRTRERGSDTAVSIAVVTPSGEHHERRMAFLGGRNGRSRAALLAAAALFRVLRDVPPGPSGA